MEGWFNCFQFEIAIWLAAEHRSGIGSAGRSDLPLGPPLDLPLDLPLGLPFGLPLVLPEVVSWFRPHWDMIP